MMIANRICDIVSFLKELCTFSRERKYTTVCYGDILLVFAVTNNENAD